MSTLWIVHRDPRLRGALAQLGGVEAEAVLGAPGDRLFEAARPAEVVLLGLAGDFEAELEFVHKFAARLRHASWLLIPERGDVAEVRRLFDTLPAEILPFPPDASALRRRLRQALRRRRADPLSERRARDALAARFGRWFADLELPEILRALDPQRSRLPLLIRGEPGTGRALLARYVHAFGGTTGGLFVLFPCEPTSTAGDVLAELARAGGALEAPSSLTICLEEVHRLPPGVQRRVQSWLEIAPPAVVPHASWLRWVGTADDDGEEDVLTPGLAAALGGLVIRIPPLRERPGLVEPFAADAALAWAQNHGERPRRFSAEALESLRHYPWPGNLRELEAVLFRTLASRPEDPIPAELLAFGELALPVPARPAPPAAAAPLEPAPAPAPPAATPAAAAESALPRAPSALLEEGEARRLAGAIAHEVRNALVPIRTFAGLLPERFDDAEFRRRFAEVVGADVRRIEGVLEQLAGFAELGAPRRTRVDMAALLDELLEGHRAEIEARRLLVLKELDRSQPFAEVDPAQLRLALGALLGKAFDLIAERGDLYLASKHSPTGLRGGPAVRVLLRFHSPGRVSPLGAVEGVSLEETSLELFLADALVRAQGGILTVDTTDADETLILLDLPA